MRYLAVSKARAKLPDLIDSIERTVITRNGEPAAVLLALDDYRAMHAMQVFSRHPEDLVRIREGHEKVQRGELGDFVELQPGARRDDLEERSWIDLEDVENELRLKFGKEFMVEFEKAVQRAAARTLPSTATTKKRLSLKAAAKKRLPKVKSGESRRRSRPYAPRQEAVGVRDRAD